MSRRRTALRLLTLSALLAGLSALLVFLGPLYARGLAALLSPFTAGDPLITTRDLSVYVVSTRFTPSPHQTHVDFHSFLLSFGYLVAVGLFLFDSRPRLRSRAWLLLITCLALVAAHVAGLYVAGSLTRAWLAGDKTPEDVYSAVTTLTLAWALVPAAVWMLWFLYRSRLPGRLSAATPERPRRLKPRRARSR